MFTQHTCGSVLGRQLSSFPHPPNLRARGCSLGCNSDRIPTTRYGNSRRVRLHTYALAGEPDDRSVMQPIPHHRIFGRSVCVVTRRDRLTRVPRSPMSYRARTKGKIERPFFYLEQHFIKGTQFASLSHFLEELAVFERDDLDVRIHSTTQEPPIDRFARELPHLTPLAEQRFSERHDSGSTKTLSRPRECPTLTTFWPRGLEVPLQATSCSRCQLPNRRPASEKLFTCAGRWVTRGTVWRLQPTLRSSR
jgi:hypothetical protein